MKDNTDKKGKPSSKTEYKTLTEMLSEGVPSRTNPLDWYWEAGRRINRLGKPAYGEGLVERIARDMKTQRVLIYNCKKFHSRWPTKDALKELIKKGIQWTQTRSLVHRWLTDYDRKVLVDYIEKNRPTTRQFKEKVQAKVKAKKRNVRRRQR